MQDNNLAMDLTEQGYVPDTVIRLGIRRLIKQRLQEISHDDCEQIAMNQNNFIEAMNNSVIAPLTDKANEQHYEVPSELFVQALGENLKYSSCYWKDSTTDLDQAERDALALTCDHAQLEDGQDILELGCGWGSLTLWMAEQYPSSNITAVSNSVSQREYIQSRAKQRGLENVDVITCDMNDFAIQKHFDRIVSIEMFEHMRNYQQLFKNIKSWLKQDGKFLMHIFVHRSTPYAFEAIDDSDWMSRFFFSGGIMPSDDLPLFFQEDLKIQQRWHWSGTHYQKTANAWLRNMDANKQSLWPVLEQTYGEEYAQQWWVRWRVFFMACEELFGYNQGQEWWVSHYLFE